MTEQEVRNSAKEFSNREDFLVGNPIAYRFAVRLKILRTLFVKGPRLKWTVEAIKEEALKHETRIVFSDEAPGAYQAARRLGILNDVCKHMPRTEQSLMNERRYNGKQSA